MSVLDRFYKRDILIQRTVEIDSSLFDQIDYLSSKVYDASISKIINACLDELIEKEKIELYERKESEIALKHTIIIRKSTLNGLENLKSRYGLSLNRLINMAIYLVLKEENIL